MPVSVCNHRCVSAAKPVAAPISNCTILQVAVLKQAMMMKPDKLRGECENSQVTEELAVCINEVEQLQSWDKEWQVKLTGGKTAWKNSSRMWR